MTYNVVHTITRPNLDTAFFLDAQPSTECLEACKRVSMRRAQLGVTSDLHQDSEGFTMVIAHSYLNKEQYEDFCSECYNDLVLIAAQSQVYERNVGIVHVRVRAYPHPVPISQV